MLATLPHPLSAMLTRGLCSTMGLLLTGGLLMTGLPSAWGQLVPAADSRLPGQPLPAADSRLPEQPLSPAGVPLAGTTSDRSRPLIAYHRDQQELGAQPDDARQPAKVPHQGGLKPMGQREVKVTDRAMVSVVPAVSPAKMPANFPRRANPTDAGTPGKVIARSLPNADNSRRLLPSAGNSSGPTAGTRLSQRSAANNRRASGLVNSFPSMDVLRTAGTGLGIALGLLLLCAWLFRRNTPSPTTPLPKEVVSVLGRAQLATRQFVQLLKVGNKLVLVSVTPEGTDPITEVTDPVEVDRLLSLCMRNHTQSTTAEFQQVLNQLSREGAKGFLGK